MRADSGRPSPPAAHQAGGSWRSDGWPGQPRWPGAGRPRATRPRRRYRDFDLDVLEVVLGELAHLTRGEPAHPAEQGELPVEEEVLRDRQLWDESEVLVDGLDAETARVGNRPERHLLALDVDLAGVGRLEAAQDLHERALACPVVANQAEHLASP